MTETGTGPGTGKWTGLGPGMGAPPGTGTGFGTGPETDKGIGAGKDERKMPFSRGGVVSRVRWEVWCDYDTEPWHMDTCDTLIDAKHSAHKMSFEDLTTCRIIRSTGEQITAYRNGDVLERTP